MLRGDRAERPPPSAGGAFFCGGAFFRPGPFVIAERGGIVTER
jgi:hypothetical protein